MDFLKRANKMHVYLNQGCGGCNPSEGIGYFIL